MARLPVKGRINQAKARVEAAQKKLKVRFKEGATPVLRPLSRQDSLNGIPGIRLGLTIRQIMKETSARTRELMNTTDVTIVKMRKSQYGFGLMCETVTNRPNNAGQNYPSRYKQGIFNLDENTDVFGKSKWIKVFCQCENFKYQRDYALHEKGVSDLKFSTDEPPDETNPIIGGKRNWGCCKHLYKLFERIVQTGR